MIKLKDILNESKWEGKSIGIKGIIGNALRYMNDTARKTVKQSINKMGDVTFIARKLDSNRKRIADIMTNQGFTDENPVDSLKIYKNAAEIVYNNNETQNFINNIITDIIDVLSVTQNITLKAILAIQSESSLKEKISQSIQKIAHADSFKIQNPAGTRYSHTIHKAYLDAEKNNENVFNDTALVNSIYKTINNLL